jgi:hypothetical protein
MLLETLMMSRKLRSPYGWWSWIVQRPMRKFPRSQSMFSSSRTICSSTAAAARNALKVEPGSNRSVSARLRRLSSAPGRFGS